MRGASGGLSSPGCILGTLASMQKQLRRSGATAANQRAAFQRAWSWYGGPEPTDAERARLDKELDAGWAHARTQVTKKKRSRFSTPHHRK